MNEKKTMNGHQFENRFKSYGIVKDANELEEFVSNAEHTADLFFEEEKPLFQKLGEQFFNKSLGETIYDELVLRFTIGFMEGSVFHATQVACNMIEKGYTNDQITDILCMPSEKIDSLRKHVED